MDDMYQMNDFSSIMAEFVANRLLSPVISLGSTNDDFCGKLNHFWSVVLLFVFAIIVTFTYIVGEPIHCLAPANWPKHDIEYVKSYCWISNTYYVQMKSTIPTDLTARTEAELTYYQWTPMIFLLMAVLFKFPNLIWKLINWSSGIDLTKIIKLAKDMQCTSPEIYKMKITNIAYSIDIWLESCWKRKVYHTKTIKGKKTNIYWAPISKSEGTYFLGYYICVKILHTINVIGQFFLLNAFMSNKFSVYGAEILQMIPWGESVRFPRVTLCDFEIRQLQNIQLFTVQCVLPVNIFNEKLFIFLWFWLIFVAVVTCGNFLLWLYRIVFSNRRKIYILNRLKPSAEDKKLFSHFTTDYLRSDGFYILRLIATNTTDVILIDLVAELWGLYMERIDKNFQQSDNCNTFKDILRENYPSKHILKSLIRKY